RRQLPGRAHAPPLPRALRIRAPSLPERMGDRRADDLLAASSQAHRSAGRSRRRSPFRHAGSARSDGFVKGIEHSVVIPLLNEEGNVRELYERLVAVLEATGAPFGIIFVDDGSR